MMSNPSNSGLPSQPIFLLSTSAFLENVREQSQLARNINIDRNKAFRSYFCALALAITNLAIVIPLPTSFPLASIVSIFSLVSLLKSFKAYSQYKQNEKKLEQKQQQIQTSIQCSEPNEIDQNSNIGEVYEETKTTAEDLLRIGADDKAKRLIGGLEHFVTETTKAKQRDIVSQMDPDLADRFTKGPPPRSFKTILKKAIGYFRPFPPQISKRFFSQTTVIQKTSF